MAHDFKKFPELTNSQMDFYYFQSPHKQIREGFMAEVIKVTDGDTIRVKTDFRDFDFPVRMSGIDAPESDTNEGRQSQKWLENKILKKEIYIKIDPTNRVGKFGRLIGEVTYAGTDIGQLSKDLGFSKTFGEEGGWK